MSARTEAMIEQSKKLIKKSEQEKEQEYNRTPSKKSFDAVAEICSTVMDKVGVDVPAGVSPAAMAVASKVMSIALRNNDSNPQVYCPSCKIWTPRKVTIKCKSCKKGLPLAFPDVAAEKNSLSALLKASDKMFPNLAHLSGDINFHSKVQVLLGVMANIIVKYVKPECKGLAMDDLDNAFKDMDSEN